MFYFRTINPSTVDLCPGEAEMRTTVETTKTVLILNGIFKELQKALAGPVDIYNGNIPNIFLSTKFARQSQRVRYDSLDD
jgi:hypothetical protein